MERNNLINYFDDIGVVIISLLALIVIVVFTVVNIFVRDIASRRAILIEGLLQNGAMGFVIGSLIYSEVVYYTYSYLCFASVLCSYVLYRKH